MKLNKKEGKIFTSLATRMAVCLVISVPLIFVTILSWLLIVPILFPHFDGYSGEVFMRIKIVNREDNGRFLADILGHSALMDNYMIDWVGWDLFSHEGRMFEGTLPAWIKPGDVIIAAGGRKRVEYDDVGLKSILEAKKIYQNRFQPFGVDWRWPFWVMIVGILLFPWTFWKLRTRA